MIYNPNTVPVRTSLYDDTGRLSPPWLAFLSGVARKSGRSMTWIGDYDGKLQFSVFDVVAHNHALWIALQAQPINGRTVTPGADDTVWELIIEPGKAANGLPPGGGAGQILAKASADDYDTKWEDAPTGGGGGGTGTVTHTAGALTADLPVFGAGGDDVKAGTKSGNTDEVMSASGAFTSGHLIKSDASGNAVDAGGVLPASEAGASHNFLTAYDATTGAFSKAQPTDADISYANEAANKVFAGPTTGSPAAPAFRSLVAADIPAIAESGVTNLTTDLAAKVPTTRTISTTSPLTGGGDLSADRTISLGTQSANEVLAGPTTGSPAAPGFRALVAADIPNIAESQVTSLTSDLALKAPLASPALTGTPTAPTAGAGTNTTQVATTAFVTGAVASGVAGVVVPGNDTGASHEFFSAYNSTTGVFTKAQPTESDVVNLSTDLAAKAPLASPALTGTPTAPTAAAGTSTTQIATTAFVEGEVGPGGTGAYFAWGGDGSDGAVTFDGSATILGLAPSSSVYTLTRDICCTDITVNSGVTIKTANWAIFATGTLTCNGTIHNDGQTGGFGGSPSGSTSGNGGLAGLRSSSPVGDGHYQRLLLPVAGTAGGNGGTTTGTQATTANSGAPVATLPVDQNGAAGATGPAGGKGGTGTSGAGGAARTGGTAGSVFSYASVAWQTGRNPVVAITGKTYGGATMFSVQASNAANGGAPGGSGGGGDTTNAGGGGGGGGGEGGSGGVCAIFAHTIAVGASGIIRSNGGNGGVGGNGRTQTVGNVGGGGGGAGGSGGIGGIVWLVYHRYTNAGTVQAAGGTHGTGGTKGSPHGTGTDDAANGANGPDGPAGNVVTIPC